MGGPALRVYISVSGVRRERFSADNKTLICVHLVLTWLGSFDSSVWSEFSVHCHLVVTARYDMAPVVSMPRPSVYLHLDV